MSKEKKVGSTSALHQKLGKEEEASQEDAEISVDNDQSTAELKKQLTQAEEKANQYWERMLRMQAETENMQRRAERDVANAHKFALEKFALELLPVIDNLERAIAAHLEDDSGAGSLFDGVSLTLQMFVKAMEKFGIECVNPEGQMFNPELHEAVSTQVDPKVPSNTVLNVLQKGYLLNKRLIRPALVVVAK